MDWLLVFLRIVHIAGAIFWAGGAFTFFLFVAPSLEALSPPNRKTFIDQFIGKRRFATIVLAVATAVVLAGAALYWRTSGGLNPIWTTSPAGLGFTLGGLAGFGAWLIAAFVIRPAFAALTRLGDQITAAGGPPGAEESARLAALGRRLYLASRALLVLLGIAAVLMASSRYIR